MNQEVPATPEKRKRGRKPKAKPDQQVEGEDSESGSNLGQDKKTKAPTKEPKPHKENNKIIKEGKKTKKDIPADGGNVLRADRSILSFFDRYTTTATTTTTSTTTTPSPKPISSTKSNQRVKSSNESTDNTAPTAPATPTVQKQSFKQSCLSFDVLDPSKAEAYFNNMAAASREDDKRHGGFMRELPKLIGRAPYEDLMSGMIMRSSKLPSLTKLNLHHIDLDMDMLADIKMVHEFLNTFGLPLGLTKDSGEWITLDLLMAMVKNPRIDSQLIDLNCKMVMAAYNEGESPNVNQYNFPYLLAAGPEAQQYISDGRKEEKKGKFNGSSKRKPKPLDRLGTIEYSIYTVADRIEALVKALHDITSSDRFHRFMRDEVEESITALKRQKRKRAEVRKELETQTHDLEREMKAIEREAAELETERQAILASERENGLVEDETKRISSSSRIQRLAQAKDARTKANELLNRQKSLANSLKSKENAWESKKEELEDISLDDTEVQKDHNVPLTQLRGGHVVNQDDKLRVISLGSDRWGRKYWFWKEFGGVIVEDRAQVGPKLEEGDKEPKAAPNTAENDESSTTPEIKDESIDDSLDDVTQRMKSMAQPDLTGDRFKATRERMSISNLLLDDTPEEGSPQPSRLEPAMPVPEKDLLDYGSIQTWSLISTSKELASLTRALNAKGARERILKTSLLQLRKEIESSFGRIKIWAGNEHAAKNDQIVSVMGTVGQALSEVDLMLLKKKRGRKSRQELADIAATQLELSIGDGNQAMDLDDTNSFDQSPDPSGAAQTHDIDMEYDGSDHEQQHDGDDAIQERTDIAEGFLNTTRGIDSGVLPSEFLRGIMSTAEERLKDLSRAICEGNADAIQAAIVEAQKLGDDSSVMTCTTRVLRRCLELMDEPENDEAEEEINGNSAGSEDIESSKTQGDIEMSLDKLSIVIPVSVNPKLLSWLKTCHIDTILDDVKTFGALHAWLDECMKSIESAEYNVSDDVAQGDEEDEEGNDEEEEEEEEADDHEDEDEGENDEEDHRSQQQKSRKDTQLKTTTVHGRALRSRNNKMISYKDDLGVEDIEEDDDDDEEEEEEEDDEEEQEKVDEDSEEESIATRLRRSKRSRH
ncbi:hypothetical protein BGZ76_005734 [Entomortierella beljakovae]|nr:hypothetical protein BGZ76_005734 [Entomortierella beljakovae]